MKLTSALLYTLPLLLTGCSVGPSYHPIDIPMPTEWHADLPETAETPDEAFVWWEALQDSQLNSLLERAYDQNLDLAIAELRICQARLALQGTAAESSPRVDGSMAFGDAHLGKNSLTKHLGPRSLGYFEAGFDAEWELDLFGRIKHETNAASAKAEASEASFCDLWVSLAAEIARNYIELRTFQKRLQLIGDSVQSQTETLQLNQELSHIGMINTIDIVLEKEQLSLLQVQKSPIEMAINKAIHRLSILLGSSPGELFAELQDPKPIPTLPSQMPLSYPSELLRRRPDIRVAERDLAAATEQVGSAVAALFPRISLQGFIGEVSPLKAFNGSPTWLAGPQLLQPLLNSKLLTQDVNYNKLKAQEACYQYQQKVLLALEEAENAIASLNLELQHSKIFSEALNANTESYNLMSDLYQKGFKDYRDLQTVKRSRLNSEDLFVQSQKDLLLNYIALYKALGG